MTTRLPCAPAPAPLEAYASQFDDLFASRAQRQGFRDYLTGLLLPRDRHKTLTCLAGTEPTAGAQHREAQRLQWFLSESPWNGEGVNTRRIELLAAASATAPHPGGVLVIDDSGDRKDGKATAHVGRQWLGRLGKTDNGIVTVSTLWCDERLYYPLHACPYTPARRLPQGKNDPGFRTKPQIAADLVGQAQRVKTPFAAVVADCFYGDNDAFRHELRHARVPYVLALKPHKGSWAPAEKAHTPVDAARALAWNGPEDPGDWTAVTRRFRDGHTETWWAADATLAGWGPNRPTRLVVATTDPALLPEKATWYLTTNLPRPGGPREADSPYQAADYTEILRCYGLRAWVEQGYKQIKDELGWADFQVRSDTAIRRHQALVGCAFSFCWDAWFGEPPPPETPRPRRGADAGERGACTRESGRGGFLAAGGPRRARLVDPGDRAHALVAGLVTGAPA